MTSRTSPRDRDRPAPDRRGTSRRRRCRPAWQGRADRSPHRSGPYPSRPKSGTRAGAPCSRRSPASGPTRRS